MTVAALLVAIGIAGASPASAAWFFKEDFGVANQPNFPHANTLAVDPQNHDLLVVGLDPLPLSGFKATISRFKPDGTADNFADLGTNVIDGEGAGPPCSPPSQECDGTPQGGLEVAELNPLVIAVAVDNSGGPADGNIYVTQRAAHLVDIFSRGGIYLGQITGSSEGAFTEITGVAVDSLGAVYVADSRAGSGVIHKYALGGSAPITNADNVANLLRTTEGGVGALAAGVGPTEGAIFASRFAFEPARLDSTTGAKQCVFGPEGTEVSFGRESLALAVDSSNGQLFNARRLKIEEYEASCLSASEEPIDEIPLAADGGEDLQGMAVDGEEGLLYISRRGAPTIEVWKEQVVPMAQTTEANPVTGEAVGLRGTVSPNGAPITECFFDYGSTATYGNRIPCEEYESGGEWHRLVTLSELGSGRNAIAVRSDVTELTTGSTYHFQLRAGNENSGSSPIGGGDRSFSTSGAQISDVEATQITSTSARIGALLDPRGEATRVAVQYLTETQYRDNPTTEPFQGAMLASAPPQVVPLSVSGSGFLFSGSSIVKYVLTESGAFAAGQEISGVGIPAGTTIMAVPNPGELELSQPADEDARGLTIEAALTAKGPQPVKQQLVGLLPNTRYRFRLVAINGVESDSVSHVFATSPSSAAPLPDGRAYEMLSPPEKAGEVLAPEPNLALTSERCGECLAGFSTPTMPMQARTDGSAVLYEGQPFSAGLAPEGNEYISHRDNDAWRTNSLSGSTTTGNWQAASGDLSRLILEQADPPLSPAAPTRGGQAFRNLYLSQGGAYEPLITVEPPTREPGASGTFSIRYGAANAGAPDEPGTAFTHIVFEANDALTPAVAGIAPAAPGVDYRPEECSLSPCDLYEWSAGALHLVNVLPGNTQAAGKAAIGSGRLLNISTNLNTKEVPNVGSAMSDNGRTVFWSSEETGQVYARVDANRTVPINGPATCKEGVPAEARACFLAASSDGSRVLLSNGAIDSLAAGGSAYLGEDDLTAGQGGFQGILGNAGDLSRIYFVDTASLTGPNAAGAQPNEGGPEEDNLYLWEAGSAPGADRTSFIASLQPEDNGPSINFGDWRASVSLRTAQSTKDGNFLVFMSRAPLTGYDNIGPCGRDEAIVPCPEVYEYSASEQHLSCVSCNPAGQRPAGASVLSLLRPQGESVSMPQVAYLPDGGGGRVFFESEDVLSTRDTNGSVMDVYEWEAQGGAGEPASNNCGQANGCVSLVSGGQSASPAVLLSSSSTGDDAFFLTRQRLMPRDQDSQMDLYDARVGGGFPEEAQPACGAEGCRSSFPSPEVGAPVGGSNSFAGPGNANTPHKAKKKHHQKKKHHKKHKKHGKHHQHSKRATKSKSGGAK